MGQQHARAMAHLRAFALAFPGAWEDHPWEESVAKVGKKVFVFLHADDSELSFSVKLPDSAHQALAFDWAEPTGYGLGRSGWVSIVYGERKKPPIELFEDWIDESYRAVAPKKLITELDARHGVSSDV